jgi:hypothetical protein
MRKCLPRKHPKNVLQGRAYMLVPVCTSSQNWLLHSYLRSRIVPEIFRQQCAKRMRSDLSSVALQRLDPKKEEHFTKSWSVPFSRWSTSPVPLFSPFGGKVPSSPNDIRLGSSRRQLRGPWRYISSQLTGSVSPQNLPTNYSVSTPPIS